ncbi:MAG: M20/M25/M40 family metallo-hydrolase [Acidobacteriia bacterium]|nr:M20/M25/M40 family metallo-hydrolase [Terriglobia bacterium]
MRRILSSAAILAAIFALSLAGLAPPRPKPASAPATEFSAVRALDTLHRILSTDTPHPVGSPANDAVRGRIVDELTRLGYQPQVQTAFDCAEYAYCATVNNVVARLDGTEPGSAVLLAAHYDSVPAGPGDSDDGTGTAAVLEIARALKAFPAPRHSIILLIDDGEEAGLLGAHAFVDSHPWAKEVRAAVNLDSRGTSGQSLLFETGGANDWAVRLYARHAPRPSSSSIAYTVYKQLPNDTDFTVFKAAGYEGLNFAYIGDEVHYHTPLDNSANVDLASLQHHGENALPAVVALANSDLSSPPQKEAVFFSVFGRWMIHWQARRTLGLALVTAILLLLQIGWMLRNNRLTLQQFLWGMIGWLATLATTAVAAFLLARLIHAAGGTPVNWVAYPLPLEIAFWSLAIAIEIALAMLFARRAGFWGLWTGVWAWWSLLSVVIAWQTPGLSYVVLVPAGVAALAGLPATLPRRENGAASSVAAILPLAASAFLGFASAILLYDGIGNRGLVPIALAVGLILTPLAPICADLRSAGGLRGLALPWIPILTAALAAFAAIVVPAYSAKAPERVNIEYWKDADSEMSQWIVQPESGRLPEPIRLAANFRFSERGAFPWENDAAFLAEAPNLDLAPPTFTVLEVAQGENRRTYRTLLRSERGAPVAAVFFPPDSNVESVRMGGLPLQPETQRFRSLRNGWVVYACAAMQAGGVEISFSVPLGKPVEVTAADMTYGLPPEGGFLLQSRPLTATPSQMGDVTLVSRRVQLLP